MKKSREIDGGILVQLLKKNANRMRKLFTALKDTPQVRLTMSMTVLKLAKILMLKIPTGAVSCLIIFKKQKLFTSNADHGPNFNVSYVHASVPRPML